MEALFGADFSDVRIHVGPAAADIGALAFTRGSDIFFAPGQFDPGGARGRDLLAHELTHVLQQRAGRASNPCDTGVVVVYDDILEAEAERMGRRAAEYWTADRPPQTEYTVAARPRSDTADGPAANAGVVQCVFAGDLAAKTFEYFKKEAAMTFKEYNDLNKSSVKYVSLAAVTDAVKSLRASGPRMPPAAPSPEGAETPPSIPATWTSTLGPLQLYRAVDLTPGKIKRIRRFSPRTNPIRALPGAIKNLLTDPRGFAEGHVRANYDFVHSAASKESCAGYQATREYVYRINVPAMYCFTPPPSTSTITREPIIWANTPDRTLKNATKVAFDPRKPTDEVDLIFDIDLSMIDQYKKKGTSNWVAINWSAIKEEL